MARQQLGKTGPARLAAIVAAGVLLLALLVPVLGGAAPWSPPATVYFPQTGHHLEGNFLTYWRDNGRGVLLGNPITEQLTENGITVQYFERARVEYHANLDQFVLGRIGSEVVGARALDEQRQARMDRLGLVPNPDEAYTNPFARLPFALFPVDPDDHLFFPESGHTLAYSFKLAWERNGGLARFGYPISEEFSEVSPIDGKMYTTQYFERARFEYHPETSANYSVVLTPIGVTAAQLRKVDTAAVPRAASVPDYAESLFVPPPTPTPTNLPATATKVPTAVSANQQPSNVPSGAKWIDINLSEQYLTAYQGNSIFWEGYISSGKRGYNTPVGTFTIFSKVRVQDMRGPDPDLPGGAYYQPDVPWVMYFADGGYAIHGVYWHSDFGSPRSHGCVGMPVGAAAALYNWAPYGTTVVIHY